MAAIKLALSAVAAEQLVVGSGSTIQLGSIIAAHIRFVNRCGAAA